MRPLSLLVFLLLCPPCATQAQERLILSFTDEQTGTAKVYSTAQVDSHSSLSVVDGQKVILQKSSGRDYRLQSPQYGWSWAAIGQVATDTTFIELTPRMAGEKVTVEINYSDRRGSDSVVYSSTVNGATGQRGSGYRFFSQPERPKAMAQKSMRVRMQVDSCCSRWS